MTDNKQLITDIEALGQKMRADAYDVGNISRSAQAEADRFQEIANITADVSARNSAAAERLAYLTGEEPFNLPQVFTGQHARNN